MELWEGRLLNGKAPLRVTRTAKRSELVGNAVLVSQEVAEGDALTCWQTIAMETVVDLDKGDELTKDLPNVGDSALKDLDEHGLVAVGTRVKIDDILIGKVSPRMDRLTSEERLIRSIFGEKATECRDASVRWPYRDEGLVIKIDSGDPRARRKTVRVVVAVERNISAGDVLEDEKGGRHTVVGVGSGVIKSDILGSMDGSLPKCQIPFKALTRFSEDKWQSRSMGPLSTVTGMPLGIGENPGQKVSREELSVLLSNRFPSIVREFLTVKSGGHDCQKGIMDSLYFGKPGNIKGTPEIVYQIFYLLRGLGFDPSFAKGMGGTLALGQEGITALRFNLATPDLIRSWSHGEVKRPETINYRSLKPEMEGIFCERIFGPVDDFQCHCGKYRGFKFKDIVCDRCGVEVVSSLVRRERMGHIDLPVPIVHPWLIPTIAKMLEMTEKEVGDLVYFKTMIMAFGEKVSESLPMSELSGYLVTEGELVPTASLEKGSPVSGGSAIKLLLEKKGIDTSCWLLEVLPVIPPASRPFIQTEDGSWATSDINDLYRRVINRANRFRRLNALGSVPLSIIYHEYRVLQESVGDLFDNSVQARPVTGSDNRQLISLHDELQKFVKLVFKRRVDFSGQAVVIPNPDMAQDEIGLPKRFLLDLFRPLLAQELIANGTFPSHHQIRLADKAVRRGDEKALAALDEFLSRRPIVLVSNHTLNPRLMFLRPVISDCDCATVHPSTAKEFEINFQGETVRVHLPLSEDAIREASDWGVGRLIKSGFEWEHLTVSALEGTVFVQMLDSANLVDWAAKGKLKMFSEIDRLAIGSR